ncbi:MAG: NADH-quinone oxidoreductase subunit L [Anaerolineae bacterium]|nr:NADH-quinone oxidoreductase subunit L [Thermoflexales bacterium]MDW8407358.1 NADH-quinone oxidoreductase subunit L [Anaerolineae bacterium]
MAALLIALAIALPWAGALAVWVAGDRRPRAQHGLAVFFAAAGGLCGLGLLGVPSSETVIRVPVGGVFGDFTFVPDGLGIFLAAIATVIGSMAVLFSVEYMKGEAQLGRYYAFVLLFIGAMAGLVLTSSLLLLFFFWEITALTSYALISFHNDDPKAVAGGIKALVITQLGGIGLLVGALVAYVNLGSYDIGLFLARSHSLPPQVLTVIAFGFLVAAAAKSAQVPFHTWLPDAMEAPTPVSALIHAATMVNAGVYVLARFSPAFEQVAGWSTAVALVGMVTALLAACMAVVTDDLKRVLAYSTVSQLGYMVFAIGAGSALAGSFHLLSHAVFKALLFLGAGAVIHAIGTRDMRQMGGLGRQMPWVSSMFLVGACALAGIPPMNGFWSKELVLETALGHGAWWGFVALLVGAGLTALYTARMVWSVFFGAPRAHHHAHDAGPAMRIPLVLLAFGTLTTWLLFGPFAHMLAEVLPGVHDESTLAFAVHVMTDPATWLAMGIVAGGLLLWHIRARLAALVGRLSLAAQVAAEGFGFETVNRFVTQAVRSTATALQRTQTGDLSWNAVGIVGALILVLILLAWGGIP